MCGRLKLLRFSPPPHGRLCWPRRLQSDTFTHSTGGQCVVGYNYDRGRYTGTQRCKTATPGAIGSEEKERKTLVLLKNTVLQAPATDSGERMSSRRRRRTRDDNRESFKRVVHTTERDFVVRLSCADTCCGGLPLFQHHRWDTVQGRSGRRREDRTKIRIKKNK